MHVKYVLYFYFSTFQSDFMLSQYFAQVLFEWLSGGSSCLYYGWYHFCFYIPHVLISIVGLLYFKIFSVSFIITFLSPEIATSFSIHDSSSLSWIIPSCLLLGKVLLICSSWFHSTFTLPSRLVLNNFSTQSY